MSRYTSHHCGNGSSEYPKSLKQLSKEHKSLKLWKKQDFERKREN